MAIHTVDGDPCRVPITVHGSVQLLPFVTALTTSGFDIRFDRETGSLMVRQAPAGKAVKSRTRRAGKGRRTPARGAAI